MAWNKGIPDKLRMSSNSDVTDDTVSKSIENPERNFIHRQRKLLPSLKNENLLNPQRKKNQAIPHRSEPRAH